MNEVLGGGELNDHELLSILENNGHEIVKLKSNTVDIKTLKNNKSNGFVISNFINLSKECRNYLSNNCNYIIYEHDHKYLISRNPALYRDFVAPPDQFLVICGQHSP